MTLIMEVKVKDVQLSIDRVNKYQNNMNVRVGAPGCMDIVEPGTKQSSTQDINAPRVVNSLNAIDDAIVIYVLSSPDKRFNMNHLKSISLSFLSHSSPRHFSIMIPELIAKNSINT